MHVSALRIYPLKSAAGLDVGDAALHRWGFEHDRRWMVIDPDGTTITARERRALLHVTARPTRDGGIHLSAPQVEPLLVGRPTSGARVVVKLSRLAWLSDRLGTAVRLGWLDDPRRRTVGSAHGGRPGDWLNLADAGPLLLTTTASLARLNDWIVAACLERGEEVPEPLSMLRFRPNIVATGTDEAFAEDHWKRLRIGDVELRFGEHCDRCVLPTIDPVTLVGGKEPTRTLARHRRWDHLVHFGIRLIPLDEGRIRVGDPVVPC
jgi:uncharacterized protein YcbX